jgi:capsule polysaccharide export protein KpsE/RkpR
VQIIAGDGQLVLPVEEVESGDKVVLGNCDKELKQLFVFGREVDDFRTLNYDRVFVTGISAIQELTRQIKTQDSKIQDLSEKAGRVSDLEHEVETLKRQLARQQETAALIEARFRAIEKAVRTASLPLENVTAPAAGVRTAALGR